MVTLDTYLKEASIEDVRAFDRDLTNAGNSVSQRFQLAVAAELERRENESKLESA